VTIRLLAAAAALALAVPANAVIVTTAPGAPDPGAAPGQTLVISFDSASAAGITQTIGGTPGRVITAAGSIGGVRAAPAGTPNGGVYQSIGTGGSNTIDFSGWTRGQRLASLSFYWGSVDTFNIVEFIAANGSVFQTVSGSNLPAATGNQTAGLTNRRVFFDFLPTENIQKIRLRSNGNAFEYDSFAATVAPVPEPASWALLITGLGLVGVALRRRARVIGVAA
jgi:hypothetical protein